MIPHGSVINPTLTGLQLHEPDPVLRSRHQLSFEGFARYLMDGDNSAVVDTPPEEDLDQALSRYSLMAPM